MRRLLRWLVNGLWPGLCLLSLLACVGTAWLWWRSYRVTDVWRGWDARQRTEWTLISGAGRVRFQAARYVGSPEAALPAGRGWRHATAPATAGAALSAEPGAPLGVRVWDAAGVPPDYDRGAAFPDWLPAALAALAPAAWVTRRLSRARPTVPGVCRSCGYDLTGNTSGRCSECGEKIEAVPAERRVTA